MLKYPASLKDHQRSGGTAREGARRKHSIPSGDLVLCNLPPYATQPWLSMGVVLHYALLAQAGIRARLVRNLDRPDVVPQGVQDASLATFLRDPPIAERLAAMEREYAATPQFFEGLVDDLLAGGERVVALCLWRNNVDVTLVVARLLKQRKPDCFLIVGGPEAVDDPEGMRLPWVDAVVGAAAEAVIVPLVEAVLSGHPERAAGLPHVWLRDIAATTQLPLESPAFPHIDYTPIVPLLVGDPEPTMPLLMNWGCPYNCGFCSNHNQYGRFTQGSVPRLLDEMDAIMAAWRSAHDGWTPGFTLQVSDATTNVVPQQFEELLRGVIDRRRNGKWEAPIRGQMLFDQRLTDEHCGLMREARFEGAFFGLDAASDTFRRALKKPGTMAQVTAAMERFHHARASGGLFFGIPVGIPGETDEYFSETERFVDYALTLEGTVKGITVLPYVFFLSAQDAELNSLNKGEKRGILWRTDGPGGDPAVRAERYMRLFERIGSRVEAVSPIPPYLALPAMARPDQQGRVNDWMERFGRSFNSLREREQTATGALQSMNGVELTPTDQRMTEMRAQAERAFATTLPGSTWSVSEIDWMPSEAGGYRGVIIMFRQRTDAPPVAVLLEPRDAARPAFARSRDFNISYLTRWGNVDCVFDKSLLASCTTALQAVENGHL